MNTYIFDGPWPHQEKFNINRINCLRMDHMIILRALDDSLAVDCCVHHLANVTGLSMGVVQNRLAKLVEFGLVCKALEVGNPSELGRPLKYYYAVTDHGTYAVEYLSRIFR